MNDFKAGDRVLCLSDDYGFNYNKGLRKGNIYTIDRCSNGFCSLRELDVQGAATGRFELVSSDKVFIVVKKNKGGALSSAYFPYQHSTMNAADVEAKRLARKHIDSEFVVFEAVSKSCCIDATTTSI